MTPLDENQRLRDPIWRQRRAIQLDRQKASEELMKSYDEEVYYPAMAKLRDDCSAKGHGPMTIERNGVGWAWERCTHCGAKLDQWEV